MIAVAPTIAPAALRLSLDRIEDAQRRHRVRKFVRLLGTAAPQLYAAAVEVENHWFDIEDGKRLAYLQACTALDMLVAKTRSEESRKSIVARALTLIRALAVALHGSDVFAFVQATARFQAAVHVAMREEEQRVAAAQASIAQNPGLKALIEEGDQDAAEGRTTTYSSAEFIERFNFS